jgi:hypothetical protein
MATLDLQQFLALAQTTPEHIWKGMERFVSRGEEEKLLRLIDALPASWWSADPLPARSPAAAAQTAFWARAIKRGMVEASEALLSRYPDPKKERLRVAFSCFAAIADARNEAVTRFFFPESESIEFASKHWEVAFKSKNTHLFDRINPRLDALRAVNFVQNYFFDLQLNQLKRLTAFIPDDQWPLRFARDAIARFRGPGMISFFIDKGFKAARVNPVDVRMCLLAAIQADNPRAIEQVQAQVKARQLPLDLSAAVDVGDVMLRGAEELRINAVKLPQDLRRSQLIEAAVLRGDNAVAQSLVDAGSPVPSAARMQRWFEFLEHELRSTGVKVAEIKLALAQASACHDFLSMVSAASGASAPAATAAPAPAQALAAQPQAPAETPATDAADAAASAKPRPRF